MCRSLRQTENRPNSRRIQDNIWKPILFEKMGHENHRRNRIEFNMKTTRPNRLNNITHVTAYKNEPRCVRVRLHWPSKCLLANRRKRVRVVDDNPAIHTLYRGSVPNKLRDRLAHTVYSSILLRAQPKSPGRIHIGNLVRRIIVFQNLVHKGRFSRAVATR